MTDLKTRLDQALPRSSAQMKRAVLDIKLGSKTWREAAIANGVTESGILRAMRRSALFPCAAPTRLTPP